MARPQASGRPGRGLGRDGGVLAWTCRGGNEAGRGRAPGGPPPASRGRSIPEQGVTLWEHRPWRNFLLCDHELLRVGHGSRPALSPSARGIGGNSATTTIRPAPQRGQTRVGVTVASWTGGLTGSRSVGAVSGSG